MVSPQMHQPNQWETYISSHTVPQMGPYQYLSDSYYFRKIQSMVDGHPTFVTTGEHPLEVTWGS